MNDLYYLEDEKVEEFDDTSLEFEDESEDQINEIPSEIRN
ncbi:hypothetical protein WT0BACILLUS_03848 [Bacillus altitudinis]|nr:hypothetical protein WT0BACILLUS_03848 [Bacillus altitudinis]